MNINYARPNQLKFNLKEKYMNNKNKSEIYQNKEARIFHKLSYSFLSFVNAQNISS